MRRILNFSFLRIQITIVRFYDFDYLATILFTFILLQEYYFQSVK